jgi:hypothetical protein
MSRDGGTATAGAAAMPAAERRMTCSAVAAQQRALAEATHALARSSMAGVGAQPVGPAGTAQQ